MEEQVEHAIDHAEMIVAVELLFQIDEITVETIETAREKPGEMKGHLRARLQEGHRVLDDIER